MFRVADIAAPRRALPTTCAAFLAAALAGPAGAEPNAPATAPARSVEVALPAPATRPVRSLAQRIVLTETEKAVFSDIRDRTETFDEPALYAMFALAARMPKLDPEEWDLLDRPAYINLLAEPDHYRLRPIRMRVKVYYVAKLQSGAGLNFSPLWPKDRPVWEMDAVESDTPYSRNKPLRIYSVVDPADLLGAPDEIDTFQRRKYKNGRELRIAAMLFKVLRTRDRQDNLRDYPELIAWQLSRTIPRFGLGGGSFDFGRLAQLVPLALLVVVMGAGFYFTRRRLAQLRRQDRLPQRFRPDGQSAAGRRAGQQQEPERVDGPVDPDLAAAAEDYLRERADDDEPDGPR